MPSIEIEWSYNTRGGEDHEASMYKDSCFDHVREALTISGLCSVVGCTALWGICPVINARCHILSHYDDNPEKHEGDRLFPSIIPEDHAYASGTPNFQVECKLCIMTTLENRSVALIMELGITNQSSLIKRYEPR